MARWHVRSLSPWLCAGLALAAAPALAAPKVIVISLDGAKPDAVERYQRLGSLPSRSGLGRLDHFGARALQNVTAEPSVTAVSHIAIATGSTAVHNDIPANTFHPVGAPIGTGISGFAAPIGGYALAPLGPSAAPTAEPLWVRVRQSGRSVVTATWPGSDGADIRIAGALVQAAEPARSNDYTLPFGAFGGLGARGFALGAADFQAAAPELADALASAGLRSFAPVQVGVTALETVFCAPAAPATCGATADAARTLRYDLRVAALDRADDGVTAYDTLVVFDAVDRIAALAGLPSTGAAVLRAGGPSGRFYFEGSGSRVGTAFFASQLAPDLSSVRLARYSASFLPRPAAVGADVDDAHANVGFWAPQPDFRIPERLSPGFDAFTDLELEAMYGDQVTTFVEFQTALAVRAIERNPNADLVMVYIEQPDGSGHQFTLTDLRQATDPRDPTSIGFPGFPRGATGQDRDKLRRYASYLARGYQAADQAVERIVQAAGVDKRGRPLSDVFVVSDHGMAPFHTAVTLRNLLVAGGIDPSVLALRTTGPAAQIYVNLAGRESGGAVPVEEYRTLVTRIASVLRNARDPNRVFNPFGGRLFSHVYTRPDDCGRAGFCTSDHIGQDSGDVFALMVEGYNFDGQQTPGVARLGDAPFDAAASLFSVPNFYGAHGHDSNLRSMSAILYAAGPSIERGAVLRRARNIDIAPTVLEILGVTPAPTVDGRVLERLLR